MRKHILILSLLLLLMFLLAGCGEGKRIKEEILAYVLENKDSIELDESVYLSSPYGYQEFPYAYTGNITAGAEYGYYYTEKDRYEYPGGKGREYKNGYRYDRVGGDPVDWYYTEKICDNWYYYELHDG